MIKIIQEEFFVLLNFPLRSPLKLRFLGTKLFQIAPPPSHIKIIVLLLEKTLPDPSDFPLDVMEISDISTDQHCAVQDQLQ